jgi:hypothetical protein
MKQDSHAWLNLVAAARRAQESRESSAPFGFAARVAALAMAADRPVPSWLDRFSWQAMGVACALAAVVVAVNFSSIRPTSDDEAAINDDPVAQVVDLAS